MNNQFTLSDNSTQSLAAQLQLNGTFNHTCRSAFGQRNIQLRMKVEQAQGEANVTIEMGGQRHSIVISHKVPNGWSTLADFIDAIANGRVDSAEPAPARTLPPMPEPEPLLDTAQQEQLQRLARKGGFADFHVGLELPVKVAVHRTYNNPGITAILSIGERMPRTTAWTLRQPDHKCYLALLQSVEYLVACATPKKAA